ncbi:hypothetical protein BDV59DRAFT_43797 [Aspergillus ambiguus]|uniref:uncharacterized protein n=1 Tax=Aspergillus ambiguus TaxID=176160 RepID=UPI003CCCE895
MKIFVPQHVPRSRIVLLGHRIREGFFSLVKKGSAVDVLWKGCWWFGLVQAISTYCKFSRCVFRSSSWPDVYRMDSDQDPAIFFAFWDFFFFFFFLLLFLLCLLDCHG